MIREATKADIPRLLEMGKRFASETQYSEHITVDEQRSSSVLEYLMSSSDRLLLVHEKEDRVDGMLGAFLFEHPFSGEVICGELFWWVDPENRGAGVRLLREMERWAAKRSAMATQMVSPTDKVSEFYERVGYRKVETTYQRRLK